MSSAETIDRTRVFPVIGLEVHAQLQTRSKLFCSCPVTVGAPANSATCPVCLGFPGTLPVTNRDAITLALKLAAAIGGEVHHDSRFARKNYFYPDLPKGYQISQYDRPISTGGSIEIDTPEGPKAIRLVRIHLEEDAGKLLHDTPYDDVPGTVSLVDWNRCGVPLLEIVSEPDIRSPEEAAAYLTELRRLLRYTGVSDADMEKGNLRCDANVSVRMSEDAPFGTRVEIKNLNSIRFVAKAIEHETERQAAALARGEKIVMETRLYDAAAGRTVSMRGKEEAHDYRYFPEPDLGALIVNEAWAAEAAAELPELPRARQKRFIAQYGLPSSDAEVLTAARELADYYEKTAALSPPKLAANWVTGEVLRWMKDRRISPEDALSFPITPERLAGLLSLLGGKEISASTAKEVFAAMLDSPLEARVIVEEQGLRQMSDAGELDALAEAIVAESPSQAALYRSGKTQTFGWFVGQVMKKTGGRADPGSVREALTRALSGGGA
ncbi:MAG TPA: Asp-tRNA(Asn)/Glu-tRNA(Gln) amidotransferase subunit GatB [Thermoanaerobaculia bacterium]|nr:Asp-tRNA(Asn)/Glu-tRNA(Gln) amidotransferase subunit GatB [Thermoanaerobaculia bacterium]